MTTLEEADGRELYRVWPNGCRSTVILSIDRRGVLGSSHRREVAMIGTRAQDVPLAATVPA